MQVNQSPQTMSLNEYIGDKAKDGKISTSDLENLNKVIDNTNLGADQKNALKAVVQKLHDATTDRVFFGLFEIKDAVTAQEMNELKALAGDNPLAKGLLDAFEEALPPSQDYSRASGHASSDADPNSVSFGRPSEDARNRAANNAPQFTNNYRRYTAPVADLYNDARETVGRAYDTAADYAGQAVDGVRNWILSQGTGLPSQNGDCGPTSLAMVAKRFGFLQGMSNRDAVQAARNATGVTRSRNGAWAVTEGEIARGISRLTGGQVQQTQATGLLRSGSANQAKVTQALRDSLARGDMPILLTGSPSTSSRHYMVVTEVKPDGTLMMADPGGGRVWPMSQSKLAELMAKADNRGGTNVMSYNKVN